MFSGLSGVGREIGEMTRVDLRKQLYIVVFVRKWFQLRTIQRIARCIFINFRGSWFASKHSSI